MFYGHPASRPELIIHEVKPEGWGYHSSEQHGPKKETFIELG